MCSFCVLNELLEPFSLHHGCCVWVQVGLEWYIFFCFILSVCRFIFFYKLLLYWSRSTTGRSGTTHWFVAVDLLTFYIFRKRTLVAAGHMEMCVNKLRSGGRSSTKFCRLNDEILSGEGRKFLLQNGAWVSELRANSITFLKVKQVICLECLYLKKDLLAVLPTGYGNPSRFALQNPLFVNLHTPHLQFMKNETMQKSFLHEAPPR